MTRAERLADFERRARHGAEPPYRHAERGWRYITVHPFADELELLARIDWRPERCIEVDAWCELEGDVALLTVGTLAARGKRVGELEPGAFASRWPKQADGRFDLVAWIDVEMVTRADFEAAMARFVDAGFPEGERFVTLGPSEVLALDDLGSRQSG